MWRNLTLRLIGSIHYFADTIENNSSQIQSSSLKLIEQFEWHFQGRMHRCLDVKTKDNFTKKGWCAKFIVKSSDKRGVIFIHLLDHIFIK